MLRVRFHGRGGHGVKTASRILGTAAFLAGWQVQDFPVYGAERRGAAVAAFTRIDRAPILERGVITHPDYLIIADETLLSDPSSGVRSGIENTSAIFVNSSRNPVTLKADAALPGTIQSLDLTSLATEQLGRASNLSAALGAAACALTGTASADNLSTAVREELLSLGLVGDVVDRNVAMAQHVFANVRAVPLREPVPAATIGIRPPQLDTGPLGVPIIYDVGNSPARQTGAWRVVRPVIDLNACTRCMICLARCPDGVIGLDEKGYPKIDYDHCKGCMICAQECPLHCIREEKEVRAW